MNRSMLRNVLSTMGTRVAMVMVSFLGAVVTARVLSPEDRGYFFYALTVAAAVTQFGNMGLHSSNVRFLASEPQLLPVLAANSLWVSIIFGSAGCLGIWIGWRSGLLSSSAPPITIYAALAMVPLLLYYLLGTNLLVGMEQFKELNILEFLNRFLGLLLFLICAVSGAGVGGFLVAVVLCAAASVVWLWRLITLQGGCARPDWPLFVSHLPYGLRAYLAALLPFVMTRLMVFSVEQLPDKSQLGYWSIASRMGELMLIIPTSLSMVLFPRLMKEGNPAKRTWVAVAATAVAMSIACGGVAIMAEVFIEYVFGGVYRPAANMLYLYLPTVFMLSIISVLSQLLAARGIPIGLLVVWGFATALNFVLTADWVRVSGALGAIKAMAVSHLIVLGLIVLLVLRNQAQPVTSK